MGAALAVAGLWILFAATHMLGSSLRFRPRLVRAVGETGFLGVYSGVALAIFVPLVWIYFTHKHAGPWLWGPVALTGVARWALYGVTGAAFVSVAAGLLAPSPASMAGKIGEPRGMLRITRHPLNMGIALFGLAHLVPNASLSDIAFFGGLVGFALLGSWHQDQRKLANVPGYREFHDATPFLPFTKPGALQGLREVPPWVLGAGVALTILLRTFHASWFGG